MGEKKTGTLFFDNYLGDTSEPLSFPTLSLSCLLSSPLLVLVHNVFWDTVLGTFLGHSFLGTPCFGDTSEPLSSQLSLSSPL